MSQLHIFEKYSIELLTSERIKGKATEEIHTQKEYILNIIETVLDEYIPSDQTIFVDRITLDLGTIPASNLLPEFTDRIRRILHQEIPKFIQQEEVQQYLLSNTDEHRQESYFNHLKKYLMYGFSEELQKEKGFDPEIVISRLLRENRNELRESLRLLKGNSEVKKRINRFSESIRKELSDLLHLDEDFTFSDNEIRKMMIRFIDGYLFRQPASYLPASFQYKDVEDIILFLSETNDSAWESVVQKSLADINARRRLIHLMSYEALQRIAAMASGTTIHEEETGFIEIILNQIFSDSWKKTLLSKEFLLNINKANNTSEIIQLARQFIEQLALYEGLDVSDVFRQFKSIAKKTQDTELLSNIATFEESRRADQTESTAPIKAVNAIIHYLRTGIWLYKEESLENTFKKIWLSQQDELMTAIEFVFHHSEVRARIAWQIDLIYVIDIAEYLFQKQANEKWWSDLTKVLVSDSISPQHKEVRKVFVSLFEFLHSYGPEEWPDKQVEKWLIQNSSQQDFLIRVFKLLHGEKYFDFIFSSTINDFPKEITSALVQLFSATREDRKKYFEGYTSAEVSKIWNVLLEYKAEFTTVVLRFNHSKEEWQDITTFLSYEQKEQILELLLPFQYTYFSEIRNAFFALIKSSIQNTTDLNIYPELFALLQETRMQVDKKDFVNYWLSLILAGSSALKVSLSYTDPGSSTDDNANLYEHLGLLQPSLIKQNGIIESVRFLEQLFSSESIALPSSISSGERRKIQEHLITFFKALSKENFKIQYPRLYLKLITTQALHLFESLEISELASELEWLKNEQRKKVLIPELSGADKINFLFYLLSAQETSWKYNLPETSLPQYSIDQISEEVLLRYWKEFKKSNLKFTVSRKSTTLKRLIQHPDKERHDALLQLFSSQSEYQQWLSEIFSDESEPGISISHLPDEKKIGFLLHILSRQNNIEQSQEVTSAVLQQYSVLVKNISSEILQGYWQEFKEKVLSSRILSFRQLIQHQDEERRNVLLQLFSSQSEYQQWLSEIFSDKSEPGISISHLPDEKKIGFLLHILSRQNNIEQSQEVTPAVLQQYSVLVKNISSEILQGYWQEFREKVLSSFILSFRQLIQHQDEERRNVLLQLFSSQSEYQQWLSEIFSDKSEPGISISLLSDEKKIDFLFYILSRQNNIEQSQEVTSAVLQQYSVLVKNISREVLQGYWQEFKEKVLSSGILSFRQLIQHQDEERRNVLLQLFSSQSEYQQWLSEIFSDKSEPGILISHLSDEKKIDFLFYILSRQNSIEQSHEVTSAVLQQYSVLVKNISREVLQGYWLEFKKENPGINLSGNIVSEKYIHNLSGEEREQIIKSLFSSSADYDKWLSAFLAKEPIPEISIHQLSGEDKVNFLSYILSAHKLPWWATKEIISGFNNNPDFIKSISNEILFNSNHELNKVLLNEDIHENSVPVKFFSQFSNEERNSILEKSFPSQSGFVNLLTSFISGIPLQRIPDIINSVILYTKVYRYLLQYKDSFSAVEYLKWYVQAITEKTQVISFTEFQNELKRFIESTVSFDGNSFLIELLNEHILPVISSLPISNTDSAVHEIQESTEQESTVEYNVAYYLRYSSLPVKSKIYSKEQFFIEWKMWAMNNAGQHRILINELLDHSGHRKKFLSNADISLAGFLLGCFPEASSETKIWISRIKEYFQTQNVLSDSERFQFVLLFSLLDILRNNTSLSIDKFLKRFISVLKGETSGLLSNVTAGSLILDDETLLYKIFPETGSEKINSDLTNELPSDVYSNADVERIREKIKASLHEKEKQGRLNESEVKASTIKPSFQTQYSFQDLLVFYLKTGSFPEFAAINSVNELKDVTKTALLSGQIQIPTLVYLLEEKSIRNRISELSPDLIRLLQNTASERISTNIRVTSDIVSEEFKTEAFLFWMKSGEAPWWYKEEAFDASLYSDLETLRNDVLSHHLTTLLKKIKNSGNEEQLIRLLFNDILFTDYLRVINASFNEVSGYVNLVFSILIKAVGIERVQNTSLFLWTYNFLKNNTFSFSSRKFTTGLLLRVIEFNNLNKQELISAVVAVVQDGSSTGDFRYQIIAEILSEFSSSEMDVMNNELIDDTGELLSGFSEKEKTTKINEALINTESIFQLLRSYILYNTLPALESGYTISKQEFIDQINIAREQYSQSLKIELKNLLNDFSLLERFLRNSAIEVQHLILLTLSEGRALEFVEWKKEATLYLEFVYSSKSNSLIQFSIQYAFFQNLIRKNVHTVSLKNILEYAISLLNKNDSTEDLSVFLTFSVRFRADNLVSESFRNTIQEVEEELTIRSRAQLLKALEEAERRKQKPREEVVIKGWISVQNAGIVMLGPYLFRYFDRLEMIEDNKFKSEELALRGMQLLQYMVTGEEETPEHEMILNKILCGLPADAVPENQISVTEEEKEVTESLLWAILQHWDVLKSRSIGALREGFLIREGMLEESALCYSIEVNRKAQDLLVDQIPWGFSTIKLPWMSKSLNVVWKKDLY